MQPIDPAQLPQLLAQHGIRLLGEPELTPLPQARPAYPHWTAARSPAAPESAHDFLFLGMIWEA